MQEACKDLAARLPELLPEDPAMTAILAEKLAGAFAEALGEEGAQNNARGGNPDNPGQFSLEEGAHGESEKARQKREKRERQDQALHAGTAKMPELAAGKDCDPFMPGFETQSFRIDRVAFLQGDGESGYIHIRDHKPNEAGHFNHQAMLQGDRIPRTLAFGTWYEDKGGFVAVMDDRRVVLGRLGKGAFVLTAYEEATLENEKTRRECRRVWNEKVEGAN